MKILYARTVGQGIVKSSDHGETWNSANRNLTPLETLTVRSVAVDPEDSAIVLRGCGKVVNGQQQSGLWRSNDGGDSWKLVTRKIDFNGQGPTSMFGEVIQFFPLDPQLLYGLLSFSRQKYKSPNFSGRNLRRQRVPNPPARNPLHST